MTKPSRDAVTACDILRRIEEGTICDLDPTALDEAQAVLSRMAMRLLRAASRAPEGEDPAALRGDTIAVTIAALKLANRVVGDAIADRPSHGEASARAMH